MLLKSNVFHSLSNCQTFPSMPYEYFLDVSNPMSLLPFFCKTFLSQGTHSLGSYGTDACPLLITFLDRAYYNALSSWLDNVVLLGDIKTIFTTSFPFLLELFKRCILFSLGSSPDKVM